MLWLWLHLIVWVLITIFVLLALFTNQHTKFYEMSTRIGYLVIIVTGIVLSIRAWQYQPVLLIIKIIAALLIIALIEIAFAKKSQKVLSKGLIWAVIVGLIIVAILGFVLAGWYPFVQY